MTSYKAPDHKPQRLLSSSAIVKQWKNELIIQATRDTLRRRATLVHRLRHRQAFMLLLGLLAMCEFLESQLFIFGSTQIMAGIEAGPREFARVQTAYTVGAMLTIIMQKRWSNLLGFRYYLLLTLLLFILSNAGCAIAHSLNELTICRLLQGVGGGALFTTSRVLVNVFFVPAERMRALRYYTPGMLMSGILAPPLAAFLVDHAEWRWIFYAPIPFTLLAMLGVWYFIPPTVGRQKTVPRLARLPLIMFAIAVLLLQWMLTYMRYDFFVYPSRIIGLLALGMSLLGGFLYWQWKHPEPILHLNTLNNAVFLNGLAIYFLYYFLMSMDGYLFPIFAQRTLGLSITTAGWISALNGIGSLACAFGFSYIMRLTPHRKVPMFIGALGLALGAGWLTTLTPDAGAAQLWPSMLLKGIAGVILILPVAGLMFSPLTPIDRFTHGTQSKNFMWQIAVRFASVLSAVSLKNATMTYHDNLRVQLQPDSDPTRY